MSLYGLTSFKLFWNPSTDTKALLAWNGETAVLAFRGTASLTNAWLDLKVCDSRSLAAAAAGVHVSAASPQAQAELTAMGCACVQNWCADSTLRCAMLHDCSWQQELTLAVRDKQAQRSVLQLEWLPVLMM